MLRSLHYPLSDFACSVYIHDCAIAVGKSTLPDDVASLSVSLPAVVDFQKLKRLTYMMSLAGSKH